MSGWEARKETSTSASSKYQTAAGWVRHTAPCKLCLTDPVVLGLLGLLEVTLKVGNPGTTTSGGLQHPL